MTTKNAKDKNNQAVKVKYKNTPLNFFEWITNAILGDVNVQKQFWKKIKKMNTKTNIVFGLIFTVLI